MKKMKIFMVIITILLLNCVSSIAQNHGRVIIGEMINDSPEITIDFDRLALSWEGVLDQGGVEINFTNFEIVEDESNNYFIIGTNHNNSIEACIALILDHDKFYEQLTDEGGGLTVTCKGCMTGCHPEIKNGKGYCLPFCTGCEKTETLTTGGVVK